MNSPVPRALGVRGSIAIAIAIVFALWGLTGCGAGQVVEPSSPVTGTTSNNQQDAVFAAQLIELNEQLVTITDILTAKTDDPAVTARLDDLSRTANERIVLAKSWLQLWGRTAVEAPPAPGLLTEPQQDALIDSSGKDLATAIVAATQSQLQGTLTISQAELAGGENFSAKQVAQKLADQAATELAILAQVKTSK